MLRHFDKESPITMCIGSKTSPLIKLSANGEFDYAQSFAEKKDLIKGKEDGDRFIIVRAGQWRSDVFELTEDDLITALLSH